MTYISQRATIEDNVFIGRNVAILGPCHIRSGSIIEDNCIIGKPSHPQLEKFHKFFVNGNRQVSYDDYDAVVETPTSIGKDVVLHSNTIIYAGVSIGDEVMTEDRAEIRWETKIGARSKIMLGCFIGAYVTVGEYCGLGGLIGNDSVLGNHVSVFGKLVHSFRLMGFSDEESAPSDILKASDLRYSQFDVGTREAAPVLEDYVTVAFDSLVIGGVKVHTRSYVTASSTVTKDVPPDTIVTGLNQHISIQDWKGPLRDQHLTVFADHLKNPK